MASEKDENLSNSTSSCERVFTAVLCCSCQTNQDDSDHKHKHMPAATSGPNAPNKSQKSEVADKKQLELPTKEVAEKVQATHVAAKTGSDEGKGAALTKSDTFSEYIHRAKMKIRTMSNIGHGKNASKEDVVHDHDTKQENNAKDGFSDYINRAKMKIRKTSSVGS